MHLKKVVEACKVATFLWNRRDQNNLLIKKCIMKIRLTIILCFLCSAVPAQRQLVLKDSDTHQPLAFATAECFEKQWGTYSDSLGRIMIEDSIWKDCALVFSFVGYASKTVRVNPQVHEILLTKVQHKLEDVLVKPCIKFLST